MTTKAPPGPYDLGANLMGMRSLAQQAENLAKTVRGHMEVLTQHYVALQTENVKLRADREYTADLLDALNEQYRFLGVLTGTIPLSDEATHRRLLANREAVRAAILINVLKG